MLYLQKFLLVLLNDFQYNTVVEINKAVKERNKRTMKDTIQAFKDDIAEGLKQIIKNSKIQIQ